VRFQPAKWPNFRPAKVDQFSTGLDNRLAIQAAGVADMRGIGRHRFTRISAFDHLFRAYARR
jgi:hypothetical protein